MYDNTHSMSIYGSSMTISEIAKVKWESIANLNTNHINSNLSSIN